MTADCPLSAPPCAQWTLLYIFCIVHPFPPSVPTAEVSEGRERLELSEGIRVELEGRAAQLRDELQEAQNRLGQVGGGGRRGP